MKTKHISSNPNQTQTHTPMKRKKYKKHGYRCSTKQKGKLISLTTVAPKRLARLVHLESKFVNKSVSALLLDILGERYAHMTKYKPITI